MDLAIRHSSLCINQAPKPFVWIADPNAIIDKVRRGKQALEPVH